MTNIFLKETIRITLKNPFLHVSILGMRVMTPGGKGNTFIQKGVS
jgi:hypothetical protein